MSSRVLIALGFLLAIGFTPAAGSFSPFVFLDKTLARVQAPVTEQEQGELNFLSCVDQAASVIPDRVDVLIDGNPDSYLRQRVQDLIYPRVRLVNESADFTVHIGNEPAPEGAKVNEVDCGGVIFSVVKNG
jgi:DNA-binding transcriptional LysR family regulator